MKSKISSFFEKNVGKLALSGIVFALALVVALTTVFVLNGKKLENKTTPPTNAETTIVPYNPDNWIDKGNYNAVNISTGAGFTDGNGTEADPYIISTARQLAGLSYLASTGGTTTYKYYKLGGDIDLLDHYWTPIGISDTYYFNGSFDGDGYVISGMVVDSQGLRYAGLFGIIKDETGETLKISNLGIENSEINVTDSSYAYAGGLVGRFNAFSSPSSLTITNSYNTGSVNATGSSASAGGLVGDAPSSLTITNSYNAGNVSAIASNNYAFAGGIVGRPALFSITIINVSNVGSVSATSSFRSYVGGLMGEAYSSSLTITNSYNAGSVSTESIEEAYAGGLVGRCDSTITITNSYNSGTIDAIGTTIYKGGLVGQLQDGTKTISNSYFDGDVFSGNMIGSGTATTTASGKVSGLSEKMRDKANYNISSFGTYTDDNSATGDALWTEAWDFASLWMIEQGFNFEYPIFQTMRDKMWKYSAATDFAGGLGTAESPYQISSAEELAYLSNEVNSGKFYNPETKETQYIYVELTADIDLSGKYWTPIIGNLNPSDGSGSGFVGSFDGKGYEINGMTMNFETSFDSVAGLFGSIGNLNNPPEKEIEIENVALNNCDLRIIQADYEDIMFGGLIGLSVSKTRLQSNSINGNLHAEIKYTAGLVGYCVNEITINNCHSGLNIYAGDKTDLVGGFIAEFFGEEGRIENSSNTGTISAHSGDLGGLVGKTYGTITIVNSYNTGSVSANSTSSSARAGGLVGICNSTLTITNSYNTGSVSAISFDGVSAGGLVGNSSSLTITNSYNAGSVNANSTSPRTYAGGFVGYSGSIIIESSFNSGKVSTNNSFAYVGGIAGTISGTATINDTFSTGDIQSPSGSGDYINTMVGSGTASITNSYYNLDMLNSSGGVVSSEKGYYSKGASDTVAFDGNIWFYHANLNEGLPLLRPLFWAESSVAVQGDVLSIFTNKGFNLVV